MFETSVAIHSARKSPWRSGLQGDCGLRYGSYRCKRRSTTRLIRNALA